MWPARGGTPAAGSAPVPGAGAVPRAGVLLATLGARQVQAAVLRGGRWLPGSLVQVAIEPARGIVQPHDALAPALARLRQGLLAWRAAQPAGEAEVGELRVLVADGWLTVATLPWSDALADPAAWQAQARAHLLATGYPVDVADTVCLDDAPFGQPRLVVVVPAALLTALQELATEAGATLRSLRPFSVAAWAVAPSSRARALAVLDEGFTAVVHGGAHIGEAVVRGALAVAGGVSEGAAPQQALQGLWQRLQARDAQLAALAGLAVLDLARVLEPVASSPSPASAGEGRGEGRQPGQGGLSGYELPSLQPSPADAGEGVPASSSQVDAGKGVPAPIARTAAAASQSSLAGPGPAFQRLDLPALPGPPMPPPLQLAALTAHRGAASASLDAVAGPPAAPSWLRWAAAAALVAATALLAQAWQLGRQQQALQAELAAQQVQPTQAARPVPWSRDELQRVHAVNGAVRELNLPISALLAALQPPAELRIAVLGVDVSAGAQAAAGSSSVKITAQARSGADMARYVAYVAQRRPFDGAYLTRHEVAADAPDRPYRFTVEASWRD